MFFGWNGVENRQKVKLCEYMHLLEHPLTHQPNLENTLAEIGKVGVSEIGKVGVSEIVRVDNCTNLENTPAVIGRVEVFEISTFDISTDIEIQRLISVKFKDNSTD